MLAEKKGTKWNILQNLREHGEMSIEEFQNYVDVNNSTLTEHLSDLRGMDLVEKRSVKDGPGRPRHVYFLTEEAEHLFPHAYAELASMLLEVIRNLAGKPMFREQITKIIKNHIQGYESLEKALHTLGFYPEFIQDDEHEKLIYHQCPFHDVAKKEPTLCEIDKDALEQITDKSVEMECSIAAGDSHCEFILTEN